MIARRIWLGLGAIVAFAGAKPPGEPANPHGSGREGTPIEREYNLVPPAEPRLTDRVPMFPGERPGEPGREDWSRIGFWLMVR